MERRDPAHPAGQSWHRWPIQSRDKRECRKSSSFPGKLQEHSRPRTNWEHGHISHRKAQAADLMQKILDVALHDLFVGIQNAKETFPAALLKELSLSAGTSPTASPGHARYHQPSPPLPSWAGGKPTLSPKTRAKIKAGKQRERGTKTTVRGGSSLQGERVQGCSGAPQPLQGCFPRKRRAHVPWCIPWAVSE